MDWEKRYSFSWTLKVTVLVAVSVMLFISGCSTVSNDSEVLHDGPDRDTYHVQIEDYLGREVLLHSHPERIISLAPAHTETLFALDLKDKIAGVTDYCDYPPEAKSLSRVGGFTDPNLEMIVSLEPDLVVGGTNQADLLNALEGMGIVSAALEPESFEQLFQYIREIALLTGREEEGEKLAGELEARVARVKEKIEDIPLEERHTVFFEIWDDPLTTVGPGSLLYDILEMTSRRVITDPDGGRYPFLSIETLFAEDPQFYFATRGSMSDYDDLFQRPGWDNLSAVKNNRFHIISDENIIYRPGPRIVEGLEEIAQALYPDLFDLD